MKLGETGTDAVVEFLKDSIKTRIQRNELYGEQSFGGAYKQHGQVMEMLFPNGITLNSPDDFNRFGVMNMMVSKLIRECNSFNDGGHEDSMRDMPVYAAMMRELDNISRGKW